MARYFTHVRSGQDTLVDPEGAEHTTLASLRVAVLQGARELVAAEALQGSVDLDQRIDAEDDEGRLVHSLTFASAVTIHRERTPASGVDAASREDSLCPHCGATVLLFR